MKSSVRDGRPDRRARGAKLDRVARASFPDLRHVRYVHLTPGPSGHASFPVRAVRDGIVGACAAGSAALLAIGRAGPGLLAGALLGVGVASLASVRAKPRGAALALVPWGILVDGASAINAVRWHGVRALDVRYRAMGDGTVRARIEVDSVAGSFVGWASDAVDLGALTGQLDEVAAASARPLAVDLDGRAAVHDGEPFVERIVDAARHLVAIDGDRLFELEPLSYRGRGRAGHATGSRVARVLRDLLQEQRAPDPSGLVAAIACELRVEELSPELSRLADAPHPAVAALSRAALSRIRARSSSADADDARDQDVLGAGDAIAWFVAPDELASLRAWRDG